jgi:hypothetical protein
MLDPFRYADDNAAHPARRVFAVTPDDIAELPVLPKALLVGGAGAVTLRAVDSTTDVTLPVAAGQILPIRAQYVRASGTTATAIVALA